MSGSVTRVPQALRGLYGPDEDAAAAVNALLEAQSEASRALEEGAIDEARYAALMVEADALERSLAADPAVARIEAEDFRAHVTSLRTSGRSSHRSRILLAMLAATIGGALLIALLTAFAYRGR